MNTLLMVAYYFAPAAVVGTQRMLRFAKYLPRAGWRTVVVTADERCYDLVDPTLSQRVDDDCVIYRTRAPNPYRVRRVYQPTVHGGMHEMGLRGKRRKNALSISHGLRPHSLRGGRPCCASTCLTSRSRHASEPS